jgi:hypothetical protein
MEAGSASKFEVILRFTGCSIEVNVRGMVDGFHLFIYTMRTKGCAYPHNIIL